MIVEIRLSTRARKSLAKVPRQVVQAYALWERTVRDIGLSETQKISGYHDEALKGKLKGVRSFRLSLGYRGFYRLIGTTFQFVMVEEVNKHDYKKSKGSSEREFLKQLLGGPLTFGMAVESLRSRDELTQTALAKRLGFSKQYLCDVEKGRRFVSVEQAVRFAKAFGHPARVLVQLALQDSVREGGLKLKVTVEEAA